MTGIADSKKNLSSRLNYFFNSKCFGRKALNEMISKLGESGEVYVFGGVLRDIALKGVGRFDSDIDLVIDSSETPLIDIIQKYCPERNKFGGYRFIHDRWRVDIWNVKDTWAFRNGLVEYKGVESLLSTTISNWDRILYRWSDRRLIVPDEYFRDLADGFLDVILTSNPNKIGLYAKLLKCYFEKNARILSPLASVLLLSAVEELTYEQIKSYELSAYGRSYVNEVAFENLKKNLLSRRSDGDLLPMELNDIAELSQRRLFVDR
ncbi:MAG: hypothetical protein VB958_02370 [Thalassolituus sp.]|uniref:hypothetical protein n=1 Tax=Thalassolituus sp. TaxID=2030822 RepID=UPI003981E080